MTYSLLNTAKSLTAEFLGTTALTFFAIGVAMSFGVAAVGVTDPAQIIGVATGFGCVVGSMVAATAGYSGGHLNPAVTLGLASARLFPPPLIVPYWCAQTLGATVGVALLKATAPEIVHGSFGVNSIAPHTTVAQAFFMELLATATLAFAVVVTANHPTLQDLSAVITPATVGTVVFVAHLLLIPFTGCSINPARALAPAIVGHVWTHTWVFVLAPLAGGVLGGAVGGALVCAETRALNPQPAAAPGSAADQ